MQHVQYYKRHFIKRDKLCDIVPNSVKHIPAAFEFFFKQKWLYSGKTISFHGCSPMSASLQDLGVNEEPSFS